MAAASALTVALVVLLHNEFLVVTSRVLARHRPRRRYRVVLVVFASLVAHALQILVFAATFWLLSRGGRFGQLGGNVTDGVTASFADCLYFSFTTYTTLGFGDIEPLGPLRFLTGLEALTGLVMITWTASFLYVEMRRDWLAD